MAQSMSRWELIQQQAQIAAQRVHEDTIARIQAESRPFITGTAGEMEATEDFTNIHLNFNSHLDTPSPAWFNDRPYMTAGFMMLDVSDPVSGPPPRILPQDPTVDGSIAQMLGLEDGDIITNGINNWVYRGGGYEHLTDRPTTPAPLPGLGVRRFGPAAEVRTPRPMQWSNRNEIEARRQYVQRMQRAMVWGTSELDRRSYPETYSAATRCMEDERRVTPVPSNIKGREGDEIVYFEDGHEELVPNSRPGSIGMPVFDRMRIEQQRYNVMSNYVQQTMLEGMENYAATRRAAGLRPDPQTEVPTSEQIMTWANELATELVREQYNNTPHGV